MIDAKLKGKTVLVTGGNSGIGAATVKAFAGQGTRVVLHFLDSSDVVPAHIGHSVLGRSSADVVAADVERAGGNVTVVAGDLLDPATPRELFEEAGAEVDILVNNATHCEVPDTITEVSPESLKRHFAVNAQASTLLIAEFVRPYRIRNGTSGRIIFEHDHDLYSRVEQGRSRRSKPGGCVMSVRPDYAIWDMRHKGSG